MIVDIIQKKASVEVSYINERGQIDIETIPAKFENWVKCSSTDPNADKVFRNWTGENVKKIPSYTFLDQNLREFLIKSISPEISKKLFAYNKPNWYAVDIEIDIRKAKGFPHPENAIYPIASIQITNTKLSTVILMFDDMNRIEGTDEYRKFVEERVNAHFKGNKKCEELIAKHTDDGFLPYSHIVFKSESEMMNKYFEYQRKAFHSIMGWNWDGFDNPYIHNRSKILGVAQTKASPIFRLDEKTNKPKHRLEVDLMKVVEKFDFTVEKTSLSLNYIASEVLEIAKVVYEGSFLDLFLDKDNFIIYSAIDTVILMMIHLQINTISSLEMVSYYAKIPLEDGFSTLRIGDALFFDEQYANNVIFCYEDLYRSKSVSVEVVRYNGLLCKVINTIDNNIIVEVQGGGERYKIPKDKAVYVYDENILDDFANDTDFIGGYVIDPRYNMGEWIALIDFKSLYPTCGQSLGCSFENIIKENATIKEQKEFAKQGHRISLNGTVYDRDNTGVIKSIWDRLIYERYHFKDIMLHIENVLIPIIEKYIEDEK